MAGPMAAWERNNKSYLTEEM